jgi:hypothetical protein
MHLSVLQLNRGEPAFDSIHRKMDSWRGPTARTSAAQSAALFTASPQDVARKRRPREEDATGFGAVARPFGLRAQVNTGQRVEHALARLGLVRAIADSVLVARCENALLRTPHDPGGIG